jgi:hypothetical protein
MDVQKDLETTESGSKGDPMISRKSYGDTRIGDAACCSTLRDLGQGLGIQDHDPSPVHLQNTALV